MAEALPPEVERLASFGRALEGTINITQDDIDEVPSDEGSPSASLEALPSDKVKLLEALKKRRTYCTDFVQDFAGKPKRMRMSLLKDGTS